MAPHLALRFDHYQHNAIGVLAWKYDQMFDDYDVDHSRLSQQAGAMFSAMLRVIRDPESPRDCLAWQEAAPLIEAGINLFDDRTQEDVLRMLTYRLGINA